ncbi:hypothetical protein [Pistricoccus aurantiacus]|uniref:hypothetical protein n=1 Tax=Pistricoccus aurantiacus TaxID=1883414 RepID=UPI00363B7512
MIHISSPLDYMIFPFNFIQLFSVQNLGFLISYLAFLGGMMLLASANSHAQMIRTAWRRKQSRDLDRALDHEEPKWDVFNNTQLPDMKSPSWASHFYFFFFTPIVVSVVSGLLLYLFGIN